MGDAAPMQANTEIIEGYLMRTDHSYESAAENTWLVNDEMDHVDNIIIQLTPPIVVFSVRLMDAPTDPKIKAELYERLLKLNATELISGAYAIDGDGIVITETLQSDTLDFEEFQAALDCLTMAITEHYSDLKQYHHLSDEEAA